VHFCDELVVVNGPLSSSTRLQRKELEAMVLKGNQKVQTGDNISGKDQPQSTKRYHHDWQREMKSVISNDDEGESTDHGKYAASVKAHKAQIAYMAFGEDTIVESRKCMTYYDEVANDDEERCDTETRCDEETCDTDTRFNEKRCGTDTDEESQYSGSLGRGFSSDDEDDIRVFSFSHVSHEQTPRSLLCDFQRNDFALKDVVGSESSDGTELADNVDPSRAVDPNQEEAFHAGLQEEAFHAGLQEEAFHAGLQRNAKESPVPFSTNSEKLQQDITPNSLGKPLAGISLQASVWEDAVTEAVRREQAAITRAGECSADAVLGVVNDLCMITSPRNDPDEMTHMVSELEADADTEPKLSSLKKVLSKRPLSSISPCTPKPSTRKSDLTQAFRDLCFVGDATKLERPEDTLLLETVARSSQKISAGTTKGKISEQLLTSGGVDDERPFDEEEEETLALSVTKMIDDVLVRNGNSFPSNDLIDLSGNVSLVPVANTLSLRHPVMAATAMEDSQFPACGIWQIKEMNEIVKDVRTWIGRSSGKPSSSQDAAENSTDQQTVKATQTKTEHIPTRDQDSTESKPHSKPTKIALLSPRRSYSAFKFSQHVEANSTTCGLCIRTSGEDGSLLRRAKDEGLIVVVSKGSIEVNELSADLYEGVTSPGARTEDSVPFDEVSGETIDDSSLNDDRNGIASSEDSTSTVKFEAGIFGFGELQVRQELKCKVDRPLPFKTREEAALLVPSKEHLPFYPVLEALIAAHNAQNPKAAVPCFNICQVSETLEALADLKSWILSKLMKERQGDAPSVRPGMNTQEKKRVSGTNEECNRQLNMKQRPGDAPSTRPGMNTQEKKRISGTNEESSRLLTSIETSVSSKVKGGVVCPKNDESVVLPEIVKRGVVVPDNGRSMISPHLERVNECTEGGYDAVVECTSEKKLAVDTRTALPKIKEAVAQLSPLFDEAFCEIVKESFQDDYDGRAESATNDNLTMVPLSTELLQLYLLLEALKAAHHAENPDAGESPFGTCQTGNRDDFLKSFLTLMMEKEAAAHHAENPDAGESPFGTCQTGKRDDFLKIFRTLMMEKEAEAAGAAGGLPLSVRPNGLDVEVEEKAAGSDNGGFDEFEVSEQGIVSSASPTEDVDEAGKSESERNQTPAETSKIPCTLNSLNALECNQENRHDPHTSGEHKRQCAPIEKMTIVISEVEEGVVLPKIGDDEATPCRGIVEESPEDKCDGKTECTPGRKLAIDAGIVEQTASLKFRDAVVPSLSPLFDEAYCDVVKESFQDYYYGGEAEPGIDDNKALAPLSKELFGLFLLLEALRAVRQAKFPEAGKSLFGGCQPGQYVDVVMSLCACMMEKKVEIVEPVSALRSPVRQNVANVKGEESAADSKLIAFDGFEISERGFVSPAGPNVVTTPPYDDSSRDVDEEGNSGGHQLSPEMNVTACDIEKLCGSGCEKQAAASGEPTFHEMGNAAPGILTEMKCSKIMSETESGHEISLQMESGAIAADLHDLEQRTGRLSPAHSDEQRTSVSV